MTNSLQTAGDEPDVVCPHWAVDVVQAIAVTTIQGHPQAVDVTLQCPYCRNTWTVPLMIQCPTSALESAGVERTASIRKQE